MCVDGQRRNLVLRRHRGEGVNWDGAKKLQVLTISYRRFPLFPPFEVSIRGVGWYRAIRFAREAFPLQGNRA
jgi:hypothetical protein